MIRRMLVILAALLAAGIASAQDGLNLPTELYVLTNAGRVQRYGMGAAGMSTVTPENTFVIDFSLAPDGNWMAYRTENSLELLNVYTGESSTLERETAGVPPFRGRGDTMAWSPSGDALAYTTLYGARLWFNTTPPTFLNLPQAQVEQLIWSPDGTYLAAEAEPNIWWIYRRDGSTLTLTSAIPSSVGLAWAGPAEIVFAPEEGGLSRMNLAEANRQTLLLDDTWVYALPYELPDGTLVVFGRQKSDTETPAGAGRLLGLAPDTPRVSNMGEAAVELDLVRWAPGGQLMVAFRGGVLALLVPTSGQGLTLPITDAAAYSWGAPLPQPQTAPLPADGFFLTDDENGAAQVWRLPAGDLTPVEVTTAAAGITTFAISPDGQTLVYASASQLWQQPLADSSAAQSLVETGEAEVGHLAISADGTLIAYDTSSGAEAGIWLVSASGGEARLLLAGGADGAPPYYRQPQFSPAGDRLLVTAAGAEATNFQTVNPAAPDAPPVEIGQFDAALWLSDGRILAYGSGAGIGEPPPAQPVVVINPADGAQTPLASIPYPAWIASAQEVGPAQVRLVLDSALPGPRALNVIDLRTDSGALSAVGSGGFMVSPALSPDGTWLAGQIHDGGPLTFRNLQTGGQAVLSGLPSPQAFQWESIR